MRKTIIVASLFILAVSAASARAENDVRWFARWESDGFSYPCTIEKDEDGKFYIRYSDGTEEWAPHWRVGKANIRVGQVVYGNWQNKGLYYEGTVSSRKGDRIHIAYEDGDEEDTTIGRIRLKLESPDAKEVGCRVFGRWSVDGYWYPGTVKEIKDGKYLVRFDDKDKAWLSDDEVAGYQPTFGDRVEGDWLGKGKFYSGKITKRNGEKIHIEYDDGDYEDTTISYLRADYDGKFRPAK
jgi:Domain of unknown function (DUF4537)